MGVSEHNSVVQFMIIQILRMLWVFNGVSKHNNAVTHSISHQESSLVMKFLKILHQIWY